MDLLPAETQSVCSSLANKLEQQVASSGSDILATTIKMLNKETDVPCAEVPAKAVVELHHSRRRKRSSRKKGSKSRSSSVNSNDLGTVASVSATSTEASKAQMSFIFCNAGSSEHGVIDMGLPSVNTNSLGSVKSFDMTPTEACEAEKSTGESGMMSVELPSQSDTSCLPSEIEVKRSSMHSNTLGSETSLKRTLSEESNTVVSFMLSEDNVTTPTGIPSVEFPSEEKDSCFLLSLSSKTEKPLDTTPTAASEDENSTGESEMMSVELPSKTQQSDTSCSLSEIEIKRFSVHSNTLGSSASLKRTLSEETKTEVSFMLSEDNATTATGMTSMELPSEKKDSCSLLSLSSTTEVKTAFSSTNDVHSMTSLNANEVSKLR